MHLHSIPYLISATLLTRWGAHAAPDLGFDDDSDLTTFVTRPEIKVPRFNVEIHDQGRITPGYWFVAPYGNIQQERFARRYYQACQTGPTIYDGNGDLIWTGACAFENRNTCDFRLVEHNGSYLLSAISMAGKEDEKGHGMILDASYAPVKNMSVPKLVSQFNMHEFKLIDGGHSALMILHRIEQIELDPELDVDGETGWIMNMGFQEVDSETGQSLFEWWAYPEVRPQESKVARKGLEGPYPSAWNWFHMNSVDKNAQGDYMVSSRFTDTIFKISGQTGRLEWRLEGSGQRSDFRLEHFNFSRQHDARWLEHDPDREVISFLDNAADSFNETSSVSSSLIVELDKTSSPWTARVRNRWVRPDDGLSRLRGNTQILKNGHVFTCWSDHSYVSEHSAEGDLLMNATFQSGRFVTYRGYKFNFTGTPREPPMLKASVYGTGPDRSTTVSHVSWNGATEVSSWSFHGVSDATTSDSSDASDATWLGSKHRTGFETSLHVDGYYPWMYAEALDSKGKILGRTPTYGVTPPVDWALTPKSLTREADSTAASYIMSPSEWNRAVNSGSADTGACSVYDTGCQPVMPRPKVSMVPTEKSEL